MNYWGDFQEFITEITEMLFNFTYDYYLNSNVGDFQFSKYCINSNVGNHQE